MKTNYVHELERFSYEKDRMIGMEKRNLLTRKSDLRNTLTKVVKEPARYDRHAMNLLNEVYKTLPENVRNGIMEMKIEPSFHHLQGENLMS